LEYKFFLPGDTWITDPLNPLHCCNGDDGNSEIRMPEYTPPPEIEYYPLLSHGTLEDTSFYSTNLDNTRTISVYLPPGYNESSNDYPVVLVHDGSMYISVGYMDNVLDYLINLQLIDPVIAVFVPPVDRAEEYVFGFQLPFTNFITEEVMPWINDKYRTLNTPGSNAVIGSSYGGNISLWIGMYHPEIFGYIGAFSPWIEMDIQNYFTYTSALDLKIYMNHASYDLISQIHQQVENFLLILEDKEYDYSFAEYPEGHTYGFWRAHIDDALMFFYPGPYIDVEELDRKDNLSNADQNHPNPFHQSTIIPLKIDNQAHVRMVIGDMNGRIVKVLINNYMSPGMYEVTWDGTDQNGNTLPCGIYYYTLYKDNKRIDTKKLIKI